MICDPIVPVPPPFVVTALTLVTNCSIVPLSYYCIVTPIVFCYVLPSTGLQWQALKSITCVGAGILRARPSG